MCNNVLIIEQCWAALLRDLKVEAKVTEEKKHSQATEGKEGYVEAVLNAGKLIAHLRLGRNE